MRQVDALAVSRSVGEQLGNGPLDGRVLASFEQACNVHLSNGEVLSLVLSAVGNGPLNIVVEPDAGPLDLLARDAPVVTSAETVTVGTFTVSLARATVWEPRPNWERLRANQAAIAAHLLEFGARCWRRAVTNGTLLPIEQSTAHGTWQAASRARAERGLLTLQRGWAGSMELVREGAVHLAGLGSGLTPAGDDFLAGMMLRAWLTHPAPVPFCQAVVAGIEGRTTIFSAALLRAAARGACSAAWHNLFAALTRGEALEAAGTGILRCGASSGADALTGFLWLDAPL
ncbi:MAG: DUF2877 domain-containing protein [Anaerolineae bacterium]|nr:DUF2877 domain-containing protein [Anaerolineae bacterium]